MIRALSKSFPKGKTLLSVQNDDYPSIALRLELYPQEVHGRKPNEDDVEAIFQDFIPLQLAVLANYADLIPGTVKAIAEFRKRGLKIGSTTGYTGEMMALLRKEAKKRGCDKHGTLLIFDEVYNSLGRAGTIFTCEHFGVTPDILVLGKGIGGGVMPLAAIIAREELDISGDRALGHTRKKPRRLRGWLGHPQLH